MFALRLTPDTPPHPLPHLIPGRASLGAVLPSPAGGAAGPGPPPALWLAPLSTTCKYSPAAGSNRAANHPRPRPARAASESRAPAPPLGARDGTAAPGRDSSSGTAAPRPCALLAARSLPLNLRTRQSKCLYPGAAVPARRASPTGMPGRAASAPPPRCGAVRCRAEWCGAERCGAVRCGAVRSVRSGAGRIGAGRCGAVRSGAVRSGADRCGSVRSGAVRCGAVRCGARDQALPGLLSLASAPARRCRCRPTCPGGLDGVLREITAFGIK